MLEAFTFFIIHAFLFCSLIFFRSISFVMFFGGVFLILKNIWSLISYLTLKSKSWVLKNDTYC